LISQYACLKVLFASTCNYAHAKDGAVLPSIGKNIVAVCYVVYTRCAKFYSSLLFFPAAAVNTCCAKPCNCYAVLGE
jgi:hypothetical protein